MASPPSPGLPCPRCGHHIATSLELLLANRPFYCSGCGLQITLDREKSKGALDALRTLRAGLEEAEEMRRRGPV